MDDVPPLLPPPALLLWKLTNLSSMKNTGTVPSMKSFFLFSKITICDQET